MDSNVNKYLTQQVMTASPAKLVFMLYDRAIQSLREAIAAIASGDIEARWRANNRAVEIVSHLWTTLDVKQGGEVAKNLDSLFPFILRRLNQVDLRNDAAPAKEVIVLLEPLRDSWRDLAADGAGQAPAGGAKTREKAKPAPPGRTSISV